MSSVHTDTEGEATQVGSKGSRWHFLGYEEVSKAYRAYDIEAGQVVISRDVNFDESAFGLSPATTNEDADDLDFDSLELNDEGPSQMQYKQTGKRKNRPNDEEVSAPPPRTVRQRPRLEESSAPEKFTVHQEEEMKIHMYRLRLYFGVQVRMLLKQQWIYPSRRHLKRR